VVVVDAVAVLRCVAVDDVDVGEGRQEHRMAMSQTWIRVGGRWQCLAGHAGPRLA